MKDETKTETVLNWVKLICAVAVVLIACNALMIKGKQGAELAGAMKTMFETTTKHSADCNEVIDFAANVRR